jgi:hypothetical protein
VSSMRRDWGWRVWGLCGGFRLGWIIRDGVRCNEHFEVAGTFRLRDGSMKRFNAVLGNLWSCQHGERL